MAIKGKRRSKSKQVSRAPRRAPVSVPTPFLQRRWLHLVTFFLLGVFAMVVFVWVTNGFRSQDQDSRSADAAATKLAAARAFRTAVDDAITTVGTVNPSPSPPTVLPDMGKTLQKMAEGATPSGAAAMFAEASKDAAAAAKAIENYGVGSTISGQGFVPVEALAFANASDQIVASLRLFEKAAEVGQAAATSSSQAEAKELTAIAQDLFDDGQAAMTQAWLSYVSAIAAGGIVETQQGGIPPTLPTGS